MSFFGTIRKFLNPTYSEWMEDIRDDVDKDIIKECLAIRRSRR